MQAAYSGLHQNDTGEFMKKLVCTTAVLLLFIWGCSHSTAPTADDYGYFPIEQVSKWFFSTTDGGERILNTFTQENTGTVQIDGKTYFRVLHTNTLPDTSSQIIYFRKDGNVLYEKNGTANEYIIADFSLDLNSKAYWDTSLTVVQKNDSLITFSTRFGVDYGHSTTYKKNTGLISRVDNGIVYWHTTLVKTEWQYNGN